LKRLVDKPGFILSVTTTPLAWQGTSELVKEASCVFMAAGLHPELVAERRHEVDQLIGLIPSTKFIGEIGIDGSPRHRRSLPVQIEIFSRVLEACDAHGGRILSVHSRGASKEVLGALKAERGRSTPILHWFTGTVSQAKAAADAGCWFSVGPPMLQSAKGQAVVRAIPRDRVLTETDGPFTTYGQNHLMPWDACRAEKSLAKLWSITPAECRAQLVSNLRALIDKEDIQRSGICTTITPHNPSPPI
jgi:TatD DNase family protein